MQPIDLGSVRRGLKSSKLRKGWGNMPEVLQVR
jgi:hypothetical protein